MSEAGVAAGEDGAGAMAGEDVSLGLLPAVCNCPSNPAMFGIATIRQWSRARRILTRTSKGLLLRGDPTRTSRTALGPELVWVPAVCYKSAADIAVVIGEPTSGSLTGPIAKDALNIDVIVEGLGVLVHECSPRFFE